MESIWKAMTTTVLDIATFDERCSIGTLIEKIVCFWKEHGQYPGTIMLTERQYDALAAASIEDSTFLGIPVTIAVQCRRRRLSTSASRRMPSSGFRAEFSGRDRT